MSLFDLSFAVAAFSTHVITVRRYDAAVFVNGRAQARTYTDTIARASVQPISGADLKRLPEGFDPTDVKSVWVEFVMQDGDTVIIGGAEHQVEKLEDWSLAGNYSKAIVRKLAVREVSP